MVQMIAERAGQRLRSGLVGQLNAEWDLLANSARAGEELGLWAVGFPVLSGYDSLVAVETAISTAAGPLQDELLIALLSLAGGGSSLAGRALLQQMLPCAVRLTANRRAPGQLFDDMAGEVLGHMYEVIATYPYARRTTAVAANLSLDTLHRVVRGGTRERASLLPAPPSPADSPAADVGLDIGASLDRAVHLAVIDDDDPAIADWLRAGPGSASASRFDLVEILVRAVDTGALSVAEARMLAQDYRESGPAGPDLAAVRGVSYSALRKRHSRALSRLRKAVHPTPH